MASPFPGGFIFCGGRWPGAYGFCVAGRLPSFGADGVSAGKRQKGWFYDRAAEGRDWFAAVPGPAPENPQQTAPLSLVSYLPEDIEDLVYVPHGMQGCVENMKGRRANRRAKGLSEWTRPII